MQRWRAEISGNYKTVGDLYQATTDSLAAHLTEEDVFLPNLCAIATMAQGTWALTRIDAAITLFAADGATKNELRVTPGG